MLSNVTLCTICRCVAKDAVSHPCDHLACAECVGRWNAMKSNNGTQCHMCRQVYPTEAQPLELARRMVQQLRLRCPLGCPWEGDVSSWTKHQTVCAEALHPCELCNRSMKVEQLPAHATECPKRLVKCERCLEAFPLDVTHLCQQEPLVCTHCGLTVSRQNLPHHEASDCPRPCGICGTLCVQEVLAVHLENDCTRPCLRCGEALRGTKATHEHRQRCAKEVVDCPYLQFGCLYKRAREETDQHVLNDAKRHANMLSAPKPIDAPGDAVTSAPRDTVTLPVEGFLSALEVSSDTNTATLLGAAQAIIAQCSPQHKQRMLFIACRLGEPDTVRRLIEAKCDINATNAGDRRPVDVALSASEMECAEALVRARCDMNHNWERHCTSEEKEQVRRWLGSLR